VPDQAPSYRSRAGRWVTVASVACALAPGVTALVVLWVLQNVGGALLTPGSLAILQASWRWIFLINLPVGIVVLLLAARHVPESKDPSAPAQVDAVGAVLVVTALAGVLFLLPVVLQVVGGYTPLESGIALLPLTVVMLLLSSMSGRVESRIGRRRQMGIGPWWSAAGSHCRRESGPTAPTRRAYCPPYWSSGSAWPSRWRR